MYAQTSIGSMGKSVFPYEPSAYRVAHKPGSSLPQTPILSI